MMQIQTQHPKTQKIDSSWPNFESQDLIFHHTRDKYRNIEVFASVGELKGHLDLDEAILPLGERLIEDSKQKKRLKIARKLMDKLEPEKLELDSGEIKKLDEDLMLEKTDEGFIIYQII